MDLFNNQFIHNTDSLYSNNHSLNNYIQQQSAEHDLTEPTRSFSYQSTRQSTDVFMPNVFVTIPLQHQPQPNQTLTLNQQTSKNNNEIKSEPIKVEISENNQLKQTQTNNNNDLPLPSSKSSLVTARPKNPVICYKCDKCPFISISNNCLKLHYDKNHNEPIEQNLNKKLSCPGCDNIFYTKKSLETHLLNDHQMDSIETETLINSLIDDGQHEEIGQKEVNTNRNKNKSIENETKSQNKNRIYIKNVKILQNPNLINSNQLFNNNNNNNNNNNSNGKIYLKDPNSLLLEDNNENIHLSDPIIENNIQCSITNLVQVNSVDKNTINNNNNNSDKICIENHPVYLNETQDDSFNSFGKNTNIFDNLYSKPKNGIHLRAVDELKLLRLDEIRLDDSNWNNSNQQHNEVISLDDYNIINSNDLINNTDDHNFIFLDNNFDRINRNSLNDMNNTQHDYFNDHFMDELENNHDENINFVCAEEIINENLNHDHVEEESHDRNESEENYNDDILISENRFNNINNNEIENIIINLDDNPNNFYNVDSQSVKKNHRGRPKGAKKTGITQLKKTFSNLTPKEIGHKCSVNLCAMRFQNRNTLEYHEKCHSILDDKIICPECNLNDFSNWNTLHTHLWRQHYVDMELYSCKLCNFKTPILSRLNNTHIKIHSTERNFKCESCSKCFKNTKQLKNHRRIHRNSNEPENEYKKCDQCSAVFKKTNLLKSHTEQVHKNSSESGEKNREEFKCENCNRVCNSKTSLKIHLLTHMEDKKFKCDNVKCCYTTNDHNAFRRHKMKHNQMKHYKCPFCNYTSIQSTTFRNHILKNHSSKATELIFQCKVCPYTTINQQKFDFHEAKHDFGKETSQSMEITNELIDIDQIDELTTIQSIDSNNEIHVIDTSNTNSNSDLVLSSTTLEQPLIRPAVFANNFSNIENLRFTKILGLNDKIEPIHNHTNETGPNDNFSLCGDIIKVINDTRLLQNGINNECFNIDLT